MFALQMVPHMYKCCFFHVLVTDYVRLSLAIERQTIMQYLHCQYPLFGITLRHDAGAPMLLVAER